MDEYTMSQSHGQIEILSDEVELVDPHEYLADIPASLISGVLGLMAFVLACVIGILAENPGYVIVLRAILAMLVCAFIGRILGVVGEICIREFVVKYKSNRPEPRRPQALVDLEQAQREHEEVVEHMKKTG